MFLVPNTAEAPGIAYDAKGAHLANANGDGRITADADGGDEQVGQRPLRGAESPELD